MANRLRVILLTTAALSGFFAPIVNAQGLAGPYLAATQANYDNNFEEAGQYYVRAMAVDSGNMFLKQNALVSFVATGEYSIAVSIANTMRAAGDKNIYADLVAMVDLIGKEDFAAAQALLPPEDSQLSPLLWGLLDAWLKISTGQIEEGLAAFDNMSENETIALFGQYNKARALAFTGDFVAAADILQGDDQGPLHLNRGSIIAHAQILMELDRKDDALQMLDDAAIRGFRDVELLEIRENIAAGNSYGFTLGNAAAYGASEAFDTMADALDRDEPSRLALYYGRLAQQLDPDSAAIALQVAEMLGRQEQYDLAIGAYETISPEAVAYNSAQIGRAEAQRRGGDVEAATVTLVALADEYPNDVNVLNALGDIYRGEDNYVDAADAYTRAIDELENPTAGHWVLFYTRGIAYEQLKNWPAAEADLRRALELSPDQPSVLNYLGYSFIEMGENLEEAQTMIETAVAGRPNDGYITDSLAWLLYRVGKFEEAVPHMERAAELLPVDPIVNDHLGDVLWMVGRKTEARFQWRRAISFDPVEVDLIRIKRKLEVGLDVVLGEEI